MQRSAQDENAGHHDRRFAAESGEGFISFQNASDVKRHDDQKRNHVGADPLGHKKHQRGDENNEKPELLRTEVCEHRFSPELKGEGEFRHEFLVDNSLERGLRLTGYYAERSSATRAMRSVPRAVATGFQPPI